jgi:hypothetical protein
MNPRRSTWFGPPQHNTLRPREMVVLLCVALFKAKLNLSHSVSTRPFIAQGLGSYTVTQDPTGGPKVVESIYGRALPARCSR